jgi:hypothetical protein
MANEDLNQKNIGEQIGETFGGIAEKWNNLSGKAKGWIAGGTAAATLGTGAGILALSEHEEELKPEQLQSGQLNLDAGQQPLRDASGKAALLNYFDADTPAEDRVLRVSLSSQFPAAFRDGQQTGDYLDDQRNHARSHTHRTEIYFETVCTGSGEDRSCRSEPRTRTVTDHHYYNYSLEIEKDFEPVTDEQAQQVKDYFAEFTRLTGIKVEVSYDDADAHIILANYRNAPDWYQGTLDYVNPSEFSTYPEGSQTDRAGALKRNVVIANTRDYETRVMLNAMGKPLGFEDGKVNIVTLRAELERLGLPVSPLAAQDTTYELESGVSVSAMVPDNIIIDNGGSNTLVGSPENDKLVSDAGLCGNIDTPTNQLTNIFGDGKRYCIAEGEFDLVQAGAGDDIIFAARGGGQTIQPGAGNDRIAYFQPDIGDTTILASSADEGSNTLYLHDENVAKGDITAEGQGNDIVLRFTAHSGRDVGSITLPDQLAGGGIDRIVVVDSQGAEVSSQDVAGLTSAAQWQRDAIDPIGKAVDDKMRGESQEMAARWRDTVRRRREDSPGFDAPAI